ncbi:MAG: 3-isopropylmalate dehydrogenase [bacterium (Candidatus Stahlbacteria) CG08_land_8_20_14_0_20_40_26]|nr:MAG: 3-isopropylmalate dehydrogenase [bacterium (Candidatus Stahlbacteria) CG23_combo_of_CG06-09_8_20_14_all_40_9]PIS26289.1 MAG: 3-isopropylmalate dehydrogenase [bacterium (Candidatus Stahlbacteria) CG08_land_8_20_14_0_20_40_26]
MARYRIAWMPGDGVGRDVMDAARIVLDKINLDAEYIPCDIGWEFWMKEGNPLPQRTIDILKTVDCALFGAITSKPKEEADKELSTDLKGKGLTYYSPIVALRQLFDLYTNMRPCKAYPNNPLNYRDEIDIVVFRENTEGLYCGVEFYPTPIELKSYLLQNHKKMERFKDVPGDELAISMRIFSKKGCRRIIRKAFEYAKKTGRRKVTVVEKPNVLRETSGMMIREARDIKREYPDIELEETNVDAMCMWLIKNPQNYSVLVTSNMFGDIISDLCSQLVGGLGFASAGNIGDSLAIFEATHGSAPKYAGQYKVNPIATILATKLMLEWLREGENATRLENAVAETIKEGKIKTYDMGGNASTLDMAKTIAGKI